MQTTDRRPVAGLQALLRESLDYAGLFPPSKLSLETAVRNYAKYRLSTDAWFLSRFVCPVNRLAELDAHVPLFAKTSPLLVSALALPIPSWKELTAKLRESMELVSHFQRAHSPRVQVDSIEVALPPDLTGLAGRAEVRDLIPRAAETIELTGPAELAPFFEVTAEDWGSVTGSTIEAIAEHNAHRQGTRCRPAAFKLRTGGVTAEAFPTTDRVASVITTCLDTNVALKCTAGLHHPLRRYDETVGTRMHGFLNIFGGAVLVHARSLQRENLKLLLEDEDRSHFKFEEDGFAWQVAWASVADIAAARRDFVLSFGSCSFEEPLEDMRKLGVL